ncbi:MAG: hypothetical protein AB1649_30465, partial [Chloroflexota bacterium]
MHLTEEQLNEYLDNELPGRAEAERHLAECADCAARLASLQALFDEIESLPEAALSTSLAARFTRAVELPTSLPRSLRLTVTLQAALAIVVMIIAAPFIMQFVSPYFSGVEMSPFTDIFIQVQSQ